MISQEDAASNISYIYYLVKMMKDHGEKEFAQLLESKIGKFYMDTEEKAK